MKNIQLKVWPEITNYLPALIKFPKGDNRLNDVFIDFSNCYKLNSSGLNIILIETIKLLSSSKKKRGWFFNDEKLNIVDQVKNLGFFDILNNYGEQKSIFNSNNENIQRFEPVEYFDDLDRKILSYPIFTLNFKKYSNRREFLAEFKEWLYLLLEKYYEKYDFHFTMLISILNEIAKNSADHTTGNAFMGLDVCFNNNKSISIYFTIGDLGVGIKKNIEKILKGDFLKRRKHWSLYESYLYALKHGFTSKPNSIENKGVGMTIIINSSRAINLDLRVFDANSMGLLNTLISISHGEIRKNFYNIGNDVGFYYFGQINGERI